MHESSLLRMKWFRDNYINTRDKIKVLDVGSYDVNGSYRQFFEEARFDYTGLDMCEGPNVDIATESAYNWDEIKNDSYDIVISGQAFEHIEFFWITMSEMVRVLKQNGLICIIAPNGFGEHRYPVDCWRFFTDGLVALARYTSLDIIHAHTNCTPQSSSPDMTWISADKADSMIIARKPYPGQTRILETNNYLCVPEDHELLRQGMIDSAKALQG